MYTVRRQRRVRLGNAQAFDICDIYSGLPGEWNLQPLNATCASGGGGYSGGGGAFDASHQFPPSGFIDTSSPVTSGPAGAGAAPASVPTGVVVGGSEEAHTKYIGVPIWIWIAGAAVIAVAATE